MYDLFLEKHNGQRYVVIVFGVLVIMLSILRLCIELFQLIKLRLQYFLDWKNYMEFILYSGSIFFAFVFTTECFCPKSCMWQWQIGVVCVFLAWIDFILVVRLVPHIGIYVVMFEKIVKNFIRVAFFAIFLVLSFAFSFYMLFHDPTDIVSNNIWSLLGFTVCLLGITAIF